ncbi:Clan MA, family M1, aminopeptidase N-like metallopeptidase [Trichomonas vaginalis G3]|uniref:Clan MA, family M1, aminopeptidase N-like metallopeptidase n=1 Tax=Trichomonas vaginalis (strain ATCC PRA-98 / G3) TaxID=412133 RepID=A2FN94_TRIV3|nr:metalloaminopeptidase protein [Trichomonas vaginalis G3]EAX93622.1 Clan MA, family M1, aminopeptidase N-like metallopeptidase [Trichomonas vaginalis G3]KAI5496135.1 metalloaminopeptidase protein [Trichomonas vaginalis G3]|eukprot:XP_001306552.1 Clan MA, family M1, aminopeptidase N-like metallopeptidase [Trichomonas vaginalis G3]
MNGRPLRYILDLTFDKEFKSFSGSVQIIVEGFKEKEIVNFDAKPNLDIQNVYINDEKVVFERSESIITTCCSIIPQKFCFNFSGTFNSGDHGIIVKDNCVITQCEADFASCIFPCFDNPENRVKISLTIHHDKEHVALSNCLPEYITEKDGITTTIFKETLPIPLYLFAFCIGKFDCVETVTKRGLPIKIYSIPEMTEYANSITENIPIIIDYLENYTETPLPLEVLQFLICREQTGMENFGLIIYGPNSSLTNMKKAREATINDAFSVFVHEIVHHWISCIVSISDWESVWIKEGFTTFMTRYVLSKTFPSLDKANNYIIREFLPTLKMNVKRPILYCNMTVQDYFNTDTSYTKASCLFHTLFQWFGEENFRKNICELIKNLYLADVNLEKFAKFMKLDENFIQKWLKYSGIPTLVYDGSNITNNSDLEIPIHVTIFNENNFDVKKLFIKEKDTELIYNAAVINNNVESLTFVRYSREYLMKLEKLFDELVINENHVALLIYSYTSAYESHEIDAKEIIELLYLTRRYESKQVVQPAIQILFKVCEDVKSEFDPNYLFNYFDVRGKEIGCNAGPDKIMLIINRLLPYIEIDKITQSMQGKFGKNAIKAIRTKIFNHGKK